MAAQPDGDTPEFNYHLLRNALNSFSKNLGQLTEAEYQQVYRKSNKSYDLESLVINSAEAQGLVIDDRLLDHAVDEVASRYADTRDFTRDLEINGLDELGLRRALYRELLFDAVMQKVAANSADVNDIDVRLFYEMHRDRFEVPEQRLASHILITINPAFPENSPAEARARMTEVVEKLAGRANRFAAFARRYSECPTAMDGGKLGEVSRGQLYAELDAVLFGMEENQISPIVESELGLHILYCERIKPGKRIPLSKVATQIKDTLEARQRRNCQKAWLAGLQKVAHG